jgi:hypothetical protein
MTALSGASSNGCTTSRSMRPRPMASPRWQGQARRHLRRPRHLPVDRALAVRADDQGPRIGGSRRRNNVRIGLEKPLGRDLKSSREINDIVAEAFPEDRTFRIDHYLGKETVQNILALRFGNSLFEPVWNAQGIATSRSPSPRRSGSKVAAASTTIPARCATWCRTICSSCRVDRDGAPCPLRRHRDPRREGQGVPLAAQDQPAATCPPHGHRPIHRRRGERARSSAAISTDLKSPRTPRPSSRSRRMSTIGAGTACPSTCAPARGWPSAAPRS